MTPEKKAEIDKKALELAEKNNCKVIPIVFHNEEQNEDIIGYIKEPNRINKLRAMDKSMSGAMTASAELFDSIILKEDSDPRFTSERSEDDKIYLGGALVAFQTIEMMVNTFKKK